MNECRDLADSVKPPRCSSQPPKPCSYPVCDDGRRPEPIDLGAADRLVVAPVELDLVSFADEILGHQFSGDLACERNAVGATLGVLGGALPGRWAFAGIDGDRLEVVEVPLSLLIAGFDVSAQLPPAHLATLAASPHARALGALAPRMTVEALCETADGAIIAQHLARSDPFFPGHAAPFVSVLLGATPVAPPGSSWPRPSTHCPERPPRGRVSTSASLPPEAPASGRSLSRIACDAIRAARPELGSARICTERLVYVPEANAVCVTARVLPLLGATEFVARWRTPRLAVLTGPTQVTPALEFLLSPAGSTGWAAAPPSQRHGVSV